MTTHSVLQTDSTGNLSTANNLVRSSPDSIHGTRLDVKKLCLNTNGNNDFHCLVSVGSGDPLYQPDNPNLTNVRWFLEKVKGIAKDWDAYKQKIQSLEDRFNPFELEQHRQQGEQYQSINAIKNHLHIINTEIFGPGKCDVHPDHAANLHAAYQTKALECHSRSTKTHCNATDLCLWQ